MNFGVGLFLFLSGILSNIEQWNPRKRITKVLIPYLLWTLIYVLIANIHQISAVPLEYLKRVCLADSASMMYYIFVYVQFTLLIPLIDKIARSRYKCLGFVITPIEIILMRYIPLTMGFNFCPYLLSLRPISCLGWFSYFYLGYVVGNGLIEIKFSNRTLIIIWIVSVVLQFGEGYILYGFDIINCGTQLKLTAVLSGVIFCLIAYRYVFGNYELKCSKCKLLKLIGDDSFGIYFGHIAVMTVLQQIPFYLQYVIYPINAVITVIVTLFCVEIGKKALGKYAVYLAL